MGYKRPKRADDLRMIDAAGVARLLREQFEQRGEWGWRKKAAGRLGLTEQHFGKLLRGCLKAVSPATLEKLLRGVSPKRRAALRAAFRPPAVRQRLEAYDRWVWKRQVHSMGTPVGPGTGEVDQPAYDMAAKERPIGALRLALDIPGFAELGAGEPPFAADVFFEILELSPAYHAQFRAWQKRLERRWGRSEDLTTRAGLALLEAVAPLAQAGRTGGVERTAFELHDAGELGRYLRAALQAQFYLLNRPPAPRRAQAEPTVPTRDNPLGSPRRRRAP